VGLVVGVALVLSENNALARRVSEYQNKADEGFAYCKISEGVYGWLTKEDYARIVLTDRSE
jgi:hypothetical protein